MQLARPPTPSGEPPAPAMGRAGPAGPAGREPPSGPNRLRLLLLAFLAVGVFGCDHATKIAAKATLEHAPAVPVVLLRYTENDDVAFSLLRTVGVARSPLLLTVFALGAIAVVAYTLARRRVSRITQIGLALILAGALGNVVDRIARGYVVDFIHVRGWPVFNIADIAVVVGMGLVAIARLVDRGRARSVA